MTNSNAATQNKSNKNVANHDTNSTTEEDEVHTKTSVISETSTTASPPTPITGLEIRDIEGVGPTTAKKLKEVGIVSVMDLAVSSAEQLAVDINASKVLRCS